jgi:hypothetical protein
MRRQAIGHVRALLPRAVLICSLAFSACVSTGANLEESDSRGAVTGTSVSPGEFPVLHLDLDCTLPLVSEGGGRVDCNEECSGVKVADKHILTAAHCADSVRVDEMLKVGQGDGRSWRLWIRNIWSNTENPYPDGPWSDIERNDVAIIETSGVLPGPTARIGTRLEPKAIVTVVGSGSGSMMKGEAELGFMKDADGKKGKKLAVLHVTEGGDSGGGAFQRRSSGELVLVGIFRGESGEADVFTWMPDAMPWLERLPLTGTFEQ